MHSTLRDIHDTAAFLRSVRPDKDTNRPAWMTWRGLCLREAQRNAKAMNISAFLEACGSPD